METGVPLKDRPERVEIDRSSTLRHQGAGDFAVQVRNVSTEGFMADCLEPVLIGSYVSLDLPGHGPVHAQVRWQLGRQFGGRFLDPISLAKCEWTGIASEPSGGAA